MTDELDWSEHPVLQTLDAPNTTTTASHHALASTPRTVRWGHLPTEGDEPVLIVAPGDTITIDTVSHEGLLEDQGRDPAAFFGRRGVAPAQVLDDAREIAQRVDHDPATDGPHVVTGPIAVAGAMPGDMLAVDVLELRRRVGYGVVSSRHGRGALPEQFPTGAGPDCVFATVLSDTIGAIGLADGTGRRLRFPLWPFLGIMGVATADGRKHSVPPGIHGGNLDVTLLGLASTTYLPIQVAEALFYVGDPHFAQGNGEVALTAFEAPLRATVRLRVVPAAAARRLGPMYPGGETDELLIAIGLDVDLDEAMRKCVSHALEILEQRFGVDRSIAYAYLSAATDFSVSQVVDGVKGVHAGIRKADLLELCDVAATGRAEP